MFLTTWGFWGGGVGGGTGNRILFVDNKLGQKRGAMGGGDKE